MAKEKMRLQSHTTFTITQSIIYQQEVPDHVKNVIQEHQCIRAYLVNFKNTCVFIVCYLFLMCAAYTIAGLPIGGCIHRMPKKPLTHGLKIFMKVNR